MSELKPLTKRTMTLDELQRRALKVLRLTYKQFRRMPHEGGMSDEEFIEKVLVPLEIDIRQDREMIEILEQPQ